MRWESDLVVGAWDDVAVWIVTVLSRPTRCSFTQELCKDIISINHGASLKPSQKLMTRWFTPLAEAIDLEQVPKESDCAWLV